MCRKEVSGRQKDDLWLGYGYSQGPFEMMLTLTPHPGGYTWHYYVIC
jgi:hypothetical protein